MTLYWRKNINLFFVIVLAVISFNFKIAHSQDVVCPSGYELCSEGQKCSSIFWHNTLCCSGTCEDPSIDFCNSESEEVTPTSDSVKFVFCTDPASSCTVKVKLASNQSWQNAATQNDTMLANHKFIFSGLTPVTKYDYDITCQRDGYSSLNSTSNFTTLATGDNVTIQDIEVKPNAYTATFSWQTNLPANSWVMVDLNGNGSYESNETLVADNNLVLIHRATVHGLQAGTTYNYYIQSATNENMHCSSPNMSHGETYNGQYESCTATAPDQFTTVRANVSPDSNIILKVNRDRVCNKWLYCNAGVEVLNTGKSPPVKEDVCFNIGLCGGLDEGGQCSKILDSNNIGTLTYADPQSVNMIKNLTGFSKAGLDWGKRCLNNGLSCVQDSDCGSTANAKCVEAKIPGYYPYSSMQEIGISMGIQNGSFTNNTVLPWKPHRGAKLFNVNDDINISNYVLKVVPDSGTQYSGVETILTDKIKDKGIYVISFLAKTDNGSSQQIEVKLHPTESNLWAPFKYYDVKTNSWRSVISLSNEWHEYILVLRMQDYINSKPATGWGSFLLSIFQQAVGKQGNFYLDNINMKSVLDVSDPFNYIQRSCRLYPDKNALACDYYNEQKNKDMNGWKGYCIEPDPAYSSGSYTGHPVCLQWWPVDVINGESNIFSNSSLVGYQGPKPLYYCLQARGEYPYVKMVSGSYTTGNISHCSEHVIDVSNYEIYKDEIAEVKIEGVRIDHDNAGFGTDDCGVQKVWADDMEHNPAKENKTKGGEGAIIFNEFNKDYWGDGYGVTIDTGDGYTVSYNKYANLRCWGDWSGSYKDISTARLKFNSQNKLTEIAYKHCDGSSNNGAGRYKDIKVILKGEICNKIVQVVETDGSNKAWVTRIKQGGWTEDNFLHYNYNQDYKPYGASVINNLDFDPSKLEQPLYVEMPNKNSYLQKPYQMRAGTPYSLDRMGECHGDPSVEGSPCYDNEQCLQIANSNEAKCVEIAGTCRPDKDGVTCSSNSCSVDGDCGSDCSCMGADSYCSNDPNKYCTSDADCPAINLNNISCGPKEGDKVIDTQCVAGSDSLLGKKCQQSSDCGPKGVCAGIELTQEQKNALMQGGDPINILSHLFVKSYRGWSWRWSENDGRGGYIEDNNLVWDKSGEYGIEPKIEHILANDIERADAELIGQGAVVLKFTSWINPDQLPLVSYSVDWGDNIITSESGLKIAPKSNIDNPHVLVHYYQYNEDCADKQNDTTGTYCSYKPKVSIKDNWGLATTTQFNYFVRVYKPGTVEAIPKLDVAPTRIDYYTSNQIPQTQSFSVRNVSAVGSAPLNWEILPETNNDKYFRDINNNINETIKYDFKSPYSFGYQGKLLAGQEENVPFTISDIGSANEGVYHKIIYIRNLSDASASDKSVEIYLHIVP